MYTEVLKFTFKIWQNRCGLDPIATKKCFTLTVQSRCPFTIPFCVQGVRVYARKDVSKNCKTVIMVVSIFRALFCKGTIQPANRLIYAAILFQLHNHVPLSIPVHLRAKDYSPR